MYDHLHPSWDEREGGGQFTKRILLGIECDVQIYTESQFCHPHPQGWEWEEDQCTECLDISLKS